MKKLWNWLRRKKKNCTNCGHKRERHCASSVRCYKGEQWISNREESIARELETDSDRVIDLGFEIHNDKHEIYDEYQGDGKCKLYCPKTKHVYLHMISVPNKFALLCRGCGETIE